MAFKYDLVVVGGCGHVGLPLGIAFADRGLNVALYDVSQQAVDKVMSGTMPFMEEGGQEVLDRVVGKKLMATTDATVVSESETVVVVVGTPIDEHLNPDAQAVPNAVGLLLSQLREGQLLVLRSTVFPGVTRLVERRVHKAGLNIEIAFCPERIAEGKAMTELYELPQIVSARTPETMARAGRLFSILTKQIVELEPEEAELAKLFTNTWRYIKFATANQLFVIANNSGLDYERIRAGLAEGYPRAKDLPKAGFAAGPCLLKDTMQLAAFNNNDFTLGHASMQINEGLPLYVVAQLQDQYDLEEMTVGILGMAFKSESDDTRSSLSYKMRRILQFKSGSVLCTDPYVQGDESLIPLADLCEQADILVVGAPHAEYENLRQQFPDALAKKPIIDIWNLMKEGTRV